MINKKTLTKNQLENFILAHNDDCQGGPSSFGWAMVEDIDKEHCRVVSALKSLGTQVFLAAKSRLTVYQQGKPEVDIRIEDGILSQLTGLRNQIKSGALVIYETRLMKPKRKAELLAYERRG